MYTDRVTEQKPQQAWYRAVTSKDQPTALVLTRQNLSQMQGSSKEALKGGYILEDSKKEVPDAIIIASGSEVELAVNAKAELAKDGVDVRVVSMPSMEAFEEQTAEYKESVLPKACRKRVAVEALSDFGWYRYVGLDGKVVSMTGFGASGPAASLFEKFGFTTENVVAADLYPENMADSILEDLPDQSHYFLSDGEGTLLNWHVTRKDLSKEEIQNRYLGFFHDIKAGKHASYDSPIEGMDGKQRGVYYFELDNGWYSVIYHPL